MTSKYNTEMKNLTIAFLTYLILISSCQNNQKKISGTEPVRVTVSEIRKMQAVYRIHSNGLLVSSEEMKLSFKTGGIVSDITVNEGNKVKKGELLASLDLSEINAAVEEAELGYSKSLRDFERVSNLYRDSVATLEQKQNASTALDLANSKLRIAKFNLVHSRIMAPENGIILKKIVKENELVASGYPVILFGSSARFWKIKAGFSDKDIVKINIGDSAIVTFDAYPGVKFNATVDQVGEMANPMTGTYEVEMSLKETNYKLASGFIAGVDLFISARDTVTIVPVESVVEADGNHGFVYIIRNEDTVSKVEVDLISVTGPDISIKGIPEDVSEVVSGGAAYLRDGEKVKVIR